MKRKLIYFAWVRERIGKSEEERVLPESVVSVGDLLAYLQTQGEEYEAALQHAHVIRVALDQEHADHREPIGDAREIALFPPMTGG